MAHAAELHGAAACGTLIAARYGRARCVRVSVCVDGV